MTRILMMMGRKRGEGDETGAPGSGGAGENETEMIHAALSWRVCLPRLLRGTVAVDAGHLRVSCRDRDRKRREEKKTQDPGKSKAGVIDDSILEKSEDPH